MTFLLDTTYHDGGKRRSEVGMRSVALELITCRSTRHHRQTAYAGRCTSALSAQHNAVMFVFVVAIDGIRSLEASSDERVKPLEDRPWQKATTSG